MKQAVLFLGLIFLLTGCTDEAQQANSNTPEVNTVLPPVPAVSQTQVRDTTSGAVNTSGHAQTIRLQAEAMNRHLLKGEFKAFIKFAHPGLINMLGGEEKMVSALIKGFKELDKQKSSILKITVDEPGKIVAREGDMQTVLTETLEMKVPQGIMLTKSALIAISKDNGKSWYFIDTGGKDLAAMQKQLPDLSDELILPKPENPKLIETK